MNKTDYQRPAMQVVKNIFNRLALAVLMPAMLLTTACSNEDDFVNNNENITNSENINTENTVKKGYELPVTVNVSREGDDATTRATYNTSTKKLEFDTGDKLFVFGEDNSTNGAGRFAGTLTWTSGGTFTGTITTENAYSGTADALFTASNTIGAELLPAGYEPYGYISIVDNEGYDADLVGDVNKAFSTSKVTAIEQFSYELTTEYSSGFALQPWNAILNFTISGLTPSTAVDVALTGSGYNITGSVTTDGSGNATFVMAVEGGTTDFNNLSLTVDGNAIALTNSSKMLVKGKVYNINRSVAPKAAAQATAADLGKVIGADGKIYAYAAAATAAGTTAVAIIAYVGEAGSVDASSTTYKGLAIAMSDANNGSPCQWYTANSGDCVSQTDYSSTAVTYKNGIECTNTLVNSNGSGVTTNCSDHTHAAAIAARNNNGTDSPSGTSNWFLPSMGQWNLIVQGLATKKNGSAVTTNLSNDANNSYKASNLNSVITDAGGTGFLERYYWSSTGFYTTYVWCYFAVSGNAQGQTKYSKNPTLLVRSAIAF